MTDRFTLYPLKAGNVWTYKAGDGMVYTNEVVGHDAGSGYFTMSNSTTPRNVMTYLDAEGLHSDSYEEGKFVLVLKANPKVGDTWDIEFSAHGLENRLQAIVKEVGISKEVEGKSYSDVVMVECESKMFVNGSWMPLNFFTQYYYAAGVGLVLTTSSHGDSQPLVDYKLV